MTGTLANRLVWTVVVPCGAFVGVLVGAALLAKAHVNWDGWRQATCMPGACFCEGIRGGTVRQIANSWSSLAFVWVAFWLLGVTRFDRVSGSARANTSGRVRVSWRPNARNATPLNAMTQRAVYPVVFALALMVVGFGSAFYHASLTFAGQFADVFGMYLIATFVLVYNVGRLRPMSDAEAVGAYFGLNVVLAIVLYAVPELRRYAFAVVVLIALAVEYLLRRRDASRDEVRCLVAAVSVLAIAFVIWALDISRVLCLPESLVQGHAVWHGLGAVACGALFLYYRSERGVGVVAPDTPADL